MNAPIVTLVHGTPESCRATATELGQLGTNTHEVGTGLYRVRSESESCWSGEAGDNFRHTMSTKGKAANDLAEASSRAKAALEKFADELQTVIALMNQARTVATEHGLAVTATTIEPPGPAPPEPKLIAGPPAPGQPGPLEAFNAAVAAKDAYDRKAQGFTEAKTTVQDARRIEADAHKALESAMKYETDFLQYMLTGAVWHLDGMVRGMVTTPQGLADTFSKRASTLYERAAKINNALDVPGITPAQQASRAAYRDRLLHRSTRNQIASTKTQTAANRMYSRTGLNSNVARGLGTTVKGVPLIGTGIAIGVQTEAVINDGKPVGKAVGNIAGGTAGGLLGAALVGSVGGPVGIVVSVSVTAIGAGIGSYIGEGVADEISEGGN